MCDVTHSYVWYDASICVTWLICLCAITHSYIWRDSWLDDIWTHFENWEWKYEANWGYGIILYVTNSGEYSRRDTFNLTREDPYQFFDSLVPPQNDTLQGAFLNGLIVFFADVFFSFLSPPPSFLQDTWIWRGWPMTHMKHACICLFANSCLKGVVAVCCSVLQYVAVCCSVLQCAVTHCKTLNTLQRIMSIFVCSRTHVCSVLQCAAVCCSGCCCCCSVVQFVAQDCNTLNTLQRCLSVYVCSRTNGCSVLQCVAVRGATLCNTFNALQQCMSTYVCSRNHVCSVLQCAAVHCRVLQYVAVCGLCCSVWHHTARRTPHAATIHSSHCNDAWVYIYVPNSCLLCVEFVACNTLQRIGAHYNTLQHTQHSAIIHEYTCMLRTQVCSALSVLQCAATHCITPNTLQRTATPCNTLQRVMNTCVCSRTHVHSVLSVLQYAAVCCGVLSFLQCAVRPWIHKYIHIYIYIYTY